MHSYKIELCLWDNLCKYVYLCSQRKMLVDVFFALGLEFRSRNNPLLYYIRPVLQILYVSFYYVTELYYKGWSSIGRGSGLRPTLKKPLTDIANASQNIILNVMRISNTNNKDNTF